MRNGDPLPHPAPQAGEEEKQFGVYIHWPFCLSKCPYCDFNSHVRREPIDEARFARAFAAEIAATAARVPGRTVSSIFFGGGTPSLMQPATIAAVLDAIARHWSVAADAEVTLEANPTSVEATRFRGYRTAGVNRVSLGVQALDDRALAELGRMHSAREALDAVGVARAVFDRFSFDLIYARPGQTPNEWASELTRALARRRRASFALSIDHRGGDAVRRAACRRQAQNARRGHRARALRHDPGDLRGTRPAGLRNLQSCAAGRRMPAQSRLLARPRICRHRTGRSWSSEHWPARHRRRPPRHRHRKTSRELAHAGRGARRRHRHRRRAHARGNLRRVPADGASPCRGHRRLRATPNLPAARSIRSASRRYATTA